MASLDQVVDAIIAEAIGEGDDGMAAVAWTMKNRANERGTSITDVVNGGAYSGLSRPGSATQKAQRDPKVRARVTNILNSVQSGAYPDPTGGATHYWAPQGMPGGKDPYWADEEASKYGRHQIGNHVFLPKRAPGLIPPGEINQVATRLDTTRTAPKPATQSAALSAMRRTPPPLPRPEAKAARITAPRPAAARPNVRNADGSLNGNAMVAWINGSRGFADGPGARPISRPAPPKPSAPKVSPPKAAPRTVAQMANIYKGGGPTRPATKPAPKPAQASTVLESRRRAQSAVDPKLQAALAASTRVMLPPLPPSSQPGRMSAASAPAMPVQQSNDLRLMRSPAMSTTARSAQVTPAPKPAVAQQRLAASATPTRSISEMAAIYANGGPTRPGLATYAAAPVRLAANAPGVGNMPSGQGLSPYQVAQIGTDINGRRGGVAPMPMPLAVRPVAPIPAVRLASLAPKVAPVPMQRPATQVATALSVKPPVVAPMPAPLSMRPRLTPAPAALEVLVQGSNRIMPGRSGGTMAAAPAVFAGTSSGNAYAAGQTYQNGNGTFRANADGSFTDVRTGKRLAGSSRSASSGGRVSGPAQSIAG